MARALRYGGGGGSRRRREVGALGGGDVDGGGARLARWGSRPDGAAAPGADEKPSVRGRAKEEGNI